MMFLKSINFNKKKNIRFFFTFFYIIHWLHKDKVLLSKKDKYYFDNFSSISKNWNFSVEQYYYPDYLNTLFLDNSLVISFLDFKLEKNYLFSNFSLFEYFLYNQKMGLGSSSNIFSKFSFFFYLKFFRWDGFCLDTKLDIFKNKNTLFLENVIKFFYFKKNNTSFLFYILNTVLFFFMSLLFSINVFKGVMQQKILFYIYLYILTFLFFLNLFCLFVQDPFFIGYHSFYFINIGHFHCLFAYDGLTLIFWHFSLLIPILCLINVSDSNLYNYTDQFSYIFFLSIALLITFSTMNIFIFFIFFELLVIPFFYKMLRATSKIRRYIAVFYLFFFTAFGSLLFLVGIIVYFNFFGFSSNIYSFLDIIYFNDRLMYLMGWFFVFSFIIKMPCFPFHTWLLEAHVEATTEGSVLLAALILKLSGYGFYRFIYSSFSTFLIQNSIYFSFLAFFGVCYGSFSAIRQTDIKRILAYSSIVHMNFSFLAFFGFNDYSLLGGLVTMAGHTLVAALLFFIAGSIAYRGRVKNKGYYKGLFSRSPLLAYFSFVAFAGNMSFPGTCNFIGEFYTFLGLLLSSQFLLLFIACVSSFACTFYSMYCFVSLIYGNDSMLYFKDLTKNEKLIFSTLCIYIVFIGFYPKYLTDLFYNNMSFLCDISNNWLSIFPTILIKNVQFSPVSIYFLQMDNWIIISFFLLVFSFGSNSFFQLVSPFNRSFYVYIFFFILIFSPFSSFFSGGYSFMYIILVLFWLFINFNQIHSYYTKYEDIYSAVLIQFFAFSCMEYSVTNIIICALLLELFGFCTLLIFVSLSNMNLVVLQYLYEYFVLMCVLGVFLLFGSTIFCYGSNLLVSRTNDVFFFSTYSNSEVLVSFFDNFVLENEIHNFLEILGGIFIYISLLGKLYGFPFYFWVNSFYEKSPYPFISYLNVTLFTTYYYASFVFSTINNHFYFSFLLLLFGFFGLCIGGFFLIVTGGSIKRFFAGGTMSMSGFFFIASYSVIHNYEYDSINTLMVFMFVYIFSSLVVQGEVMCFRNKYGVPVSSFYELEEGKNSFNVYNKILLVFYIFNYAGYVPGIIFFYKMQIISIIINGVGTSLFLLFFIFNILMVLYACVRLASFFLSKKEYYRSDWPNVLQNKNIKNNNNSWYNDNSFGLIYKGSYNNLLYNNDVFIKLEKFIYVLIVAFIMLFILLFTFFNSFPGL